MRVQPFNYPLDDYLLKLIDIMIARCVQSNPKKDAVLLFEGAEGEGKTTFSVALGYYIALKTGREFDHTHVFFDLNEMIDFLKSTDDQIAIWDEPALQALSKDALTGVVKNLERLLMMARKKRHFIMINMAYFNKFSEYIVWQRPLGMIHVYSRNEIQAGRYVYIRKRNLEKLWYDWKIKKKRSYRKYCSKAIRGTFPDVMNPNYKNNVLSDFNINFYEDKKDKAIQMIGAKDAKKDRISKTELKLRKIQYLVSQMENRNELAEKLGITPSAIAMWADRYREDDENEEIAKKNGVSTP